MKKQILLLSLVLSIIIASSFQTNNPPQTISITTQERDEIVKILTTSYNTAQAQKCITVGDAEAILIPLANSINFLKNKGVDTTKKRQ